MRRIDKNVTRVSGPRAVSRPPPGWHRNIKTDGVFLTEMHSRLNPLTPRHGAHKSTRHGNFRRFGSLTSCQKSQHLWSNNQLKESSRPDFFRSIQTVTRGQTPACTRNAQGNGYVVAFFKNGVQYVPGPGELSNFSGVRRVESLFHRTRLQYASRVIDTNPITKRMQIVDIVRDQDQVCAGLLDNFAQLAS